MISKDQLCMFFPTFLEHESVCLEVVCFNWNIKGGVQVASYCFIDFPPSLIICTLVKDFFKSLVENSLGKKVWTCVVVLALS